MHDAVVDVSDENILLARRHDGLIRLHAVSVSEKQLVGRIFGLINPRILQICQMRQKLLPRRFGNLNAGHHPPRVGTMITVMKQRDVPASANRLEKTQ